MKEKMKIRTLYPDEIEVKTQTVKKTGASVVLYKDSRVDMNILDETFGTMGWKNEHSVIDGKTFCTISLWDDEKNEWVTKSNVGSLDSGAPGAAKVKGEISDSFKRAATVVGIGRELYTSPFIWIDSSKIEISENNGRFNVRTDMRVNVIEYDENRRINKLEIVNAKTGAPIFRWMSGKKAAAATTAPATQKAPAPKKEEKSAAPTPAPEAVKPAPTPAQTAPAPVQETAAAAPVEPIQPAPEPAENTGAIKVEQVTAPESSDPGEAVVPIGYASGETLKEFYQREAKRAMDKGLPVDLDKMFGYYENLSAPKYADFKEAVKQFKASLKAS